MKNIELRMITKKQLESGYSYIEYRNLVNEKLSSDQTTGSSNTDYLLGVTKMNVHRMDRLDKHYVPGSEIQELMNQIDGKMIWVVLSEGWCADASQSLPVLAKIAELSPKVAFKILLRDEHPELIDQFLSNGSRSIPKLIIYNEGLEYLADWGPRPEEIQNQVLDWKHEQGLNSDEIGKLVQKWYAKDAGRTLEKELSELLLKLSSN